MTSTRLTVVIAVLLLAIIMAPLTGAMGAAAATQQESATVGDYTVIRGNSVAISVSHSAPATLTIGDANRGFAVTVPLGGGGTDTVEFNTYRTTSPNPNAFLTVNGGGAPGGTSVTTPSGDGLSKVLSPGEYTLTVSIDGTLKDVGNLQVKPRHQTTSEMARLPYTTEIDTDDTTIESEDASTAELYNQLTTGNDIVHGEYAALMVRDSGLGGAFGKNPTSGSLADEGIHLRVKELSPEPGTEAETATVDNLLIREQIHAKNTQEGPHNRFLAIWNTSAVDMNLGRGYTYEFQIVLDGAKNPLVTSNETVASQRINLKHPMIQLQAEPGFTLAPWNDSEMLISGETNFAPGTSLSVSALQTRPDSKLWERTVSTDNDGSFSVTFDFADVPRPNEFPLWVQGFKDRTDYSVRFPDTDATLQLPDQTATNRTVTVRDVALPRAGFVKLTAANKQIGVSRYLTAGVYDRVNVTLNTTLTEPTEVRAIAVEDTNGSEAIEANDSIFTARGSPVADTGLIKPQVVTTTTAGTTTANTTTTTVSIPVHEPEPLAPVESSSSPGFAPLSPLTVVLAAAVAVLLATRYRTL